MKKLSILLFVLFFYQYAISQPCLPEGITFTTQAEIDNFTTNYPNCDEIEGYVQISGEDITNLDGLNVITSIGEHTVISHTSLADLNGLNNLTTIGGFLRISTNDSLTALTGLENLTTIEGTFDIGGNMGGGNSLLKNLNGLESLLFIGGSLRIYNNTQLASLSGLENLNTIMQGLVIGDDLNSLGNPGNPSLKNISALVNLTNLNTTLRILYNDSLTNLAGLDGLVSIGNDLWIEGNGSLTNLDGLENLSSIGEYLAINNNPELLSITGIKSIEANSISDLYIRDNNSLATCAVQSICDYLVAPNGAIEIYDNATGCNSQQEVEEACLVSVNEIISNDCFTISPNPLGTTTQIEFTLNTKSQVTIQILDISGQEIKTLVNEMHQKGEYKIAFDGTTIKAGIYFCVLKIYDGVLTRKMVKM